LGVRKAALPGEKRKEALEIMGGEVRRWVGGAEDTRRGIRFGSSGLGCSGGSLRSY